MDQIQPIIIMCQLLMHFCGGVTPDSVRLAYMYHSCMGNPVEWMVYKMAAWAEDCDE